MKTFTSSKSSALSCLGVPAVAYWMVSCAPTHSPRTVDYYLAHKEEMAAMVAKCSNDPGGFGGSGECTNAVRAASIDSWGSYKDQPPLGLTESSGNSEQRAGR